MMIENFVLCPSREAAKMRQKGSPVLPSISSPEGVGGGENFVELVLGASRNDLHFCHPRFPILGHGYDDSKSGMSSGTGIC